MRAVLLHRLVAAPAGAAAAAAAAASISEKGSHRASSRLATSASRSLTDSLLQQPRRKFASAATTTQPKPQSPSAVSAASVPLKSAGEAAAPAKQGAGFVAWYESHLQSSPVKTKMVTGAFLWGLGDLVAQVVPAVTHNDAKDNPEAVAAAAATAPLKPFSYDYARTARAVLFGFGIHAPCAHVHYNFLEWMTVRAGITGGISIPVFKAVMEQFVYWSWFSNSLYHGAMGAMQGMGPQEIYDRIADVLWETQKAQWVFWIPIQLLNFRFVPVRHQLNVVLITSVVWTALLSAWYPPEEEEEGTKKAEDKGAQ